MAKDKILAVVQIALMLAIQWGVISVMNGVWA